MDLRHIPEEDRDVLLDVESITAAFGRAVYAHVMTQPDLMLAFARYNTTQDQLIAQTISNMRHDLPNPYEIENPADRRQVEMRQSILNSQESDHFIGICRRFLRQETMGGLVHPAAMKSPAAYISTMERYGLRHTASAIGYRLALSKG